jgi:hypothetical protein
MFKPRKGIDGESRTLANGMQKHPSPGNWDLVLVKSKTSSLSAWLDNEQAICVGWNGTPSPDDINTHLH